MKKKPKRRPTPAQPGLATSSSHPAPSLAQRAGTRWLDRYKVPGLILLYVLLALNFVRLPKIAVNNTHDPGSHMAFEFYAKHKYQFGVDVVQNVGPYGYLSYPYDYSGILPTQKLLFGILFGLTLAWFALEARRYFFSTTGKVMWFLAIFLALVPRYEELDPISELFILLAGHQLLLFGRDRPGRFVSDAVLCIFLSLLALMKSTNVMLVGVLSVLIVVERVRTRTFLDLACNLGCLAISTCVFWALAGQKFSNIPAFMHGAATFSKGYNEALSHANDYPEMVFWGLLPPLLFVALNVLRVLRFRIYCHRLLTSVFEAACIFVIWKHGHVRSGHEGFYWASVIPIAPLLFLAHEKPVAEEKSIPAKSSRKGSAVLIQRNDSMYRLGMTFVILCCLFVIRPSIIEEANPNFASYQNPWTVVANPARRMDANLWELLDWPGHLSALKASLEKNREEAALPKVKETIGNATIDMFGFLPGVILLNDLNYKPRPMPINFAATTQELMERNAKFYRNDATAPEYLLALIYQIDGRFAPQDDALAVPEVLEHYSPVLMDHGFILLKRTPRTPDLQRTFLSSKTINWGETVRLPPTGTNLLWCSADINFTLLGKARSTLFQPAQLFIVLQSAGRHLGPTRLLQSGASTGFMLRPLIVNGVDFFAAYGLRVEPAATRTPSFDEMGFLISPDDQAFFEPKITVSFWSIGPKHD